MTTYYINGEQYPYPAGDAHGGSGEGYPYVYGYCPERNEYYLPDPGPEIEKTEVQIVNCNGYTIQITPGQRKYGGPPPDWTTPFPGEECEIYCGKLPRYMLEDELLPLFEKYGRIWEFRLMMSEYFHKNRGFAFVRYTTEESAMAAISHLNDKQIGRSDRGLRVEACAKKVRLYVANIPKAKSKEELHEEFDKQTKGLKEVIIYSPADERDKVKKNRGFCFLDYDSHFNAFAAKKQLAKSFRKIWGCELVVDWADPIKEPEEEVMAKVKVLYVRNLTSRATEERLHALFSTYGVVERVKRLKDFAFVHFAERADAEKAMKEQQGEEFCGTNLQVEWGKPPEDKKQLEEVLRARERRMADGYYCGPYAAYPSYPPTAAGCVDYSGQAYDPNGYYDPSAYYNYDYYNRDYDYMNGAAYYAQASSLNSSGHSMYPDSSPPSSPEVYRRGPLPDNYRPNTGIRILDSPPPPSPDTRSHYRRRRSYRERNSRKNTHYPSEKEDNWRRKSDSHRRNYAHGEPPSPSPPCTPPHNASNPNSPIHWRSRR